MNRIIYVGKHAVTYDVSKHFHMSWELIYCTSGGGELIFEDRVITYRANSLMIIPPMMVHRNHSTSGFTNIHINMVDVSFGYTEPVLVQITPDYYLQHAFEAAFFYYSNQGLAQKRLLPMYGQLIVTTILSCVEDGSRSEIVRTICDHIVRNYPDAGFDLNAYLKSLSFSTEYLRKLFKKEMGITPRQYLTNCRLENASNLLAIAGSSNSINQVARQSGFSDPLYFSKLFKQRYGVSPKYYTPAESPENSASDTTRFDLEQDQDQASSKQS
ncbi:MAG: helix-turn-helix domain-containing protein [Oscillospiraceae bacterium]|nr:helix-turn-helix domain-containing protein [Oscillospiraceae bacterium]